MSLQQVIAGTGAATLVNENFDSVGPASLFGKRPAATSGLTLGYYGGQFNGVAVPDGTVELIASATNYVVADRTTGAVSAATTTTNWLNTSDYLQLHQIATGATTITAFVDCRQAYGIAGGGGGGAPAWSDLTGVPPPISDIAALTDPGADRLLFWDDSASGYKHLALGTNLAISGTTLNAIGGSGGSGIVETIVAGSGVSVDATDPANPIVSATGGGGALTNFVEAASTASPNSSVNVSSLTAGSGTTDVDFAVVRKGAGALLAAIPDATAAGGNKRGANAVDLQAVRASADQVASGARSVIVGGFNNKAAASHSFVGAGEGNSTQASRSAVVAGDGNATGGSSAFVGAGVGNLASGDFSAVPGGSGNTASGLYAMTWGSSCVASGQGSTAFGQSCEADSTCSTAGGRGSKASASDGLALGQGVLASGVSGTAFGANTVASGAYSLATGFYATTRGVLGASAHSAGRFSATGDAQAQRFLLRTATSDATPAAATADAGVAASSNQVVVPTDSAVAFSAVVVARNSSSGDAARWVVQGLVKNVGGTVSIVGTPSATKDHADSGASSWSLAVSADNTNKSVAFAVTGAVASGLKWVVSAATVEVVG
ncbi:hypothetical protein [Variovorax sp. UMC13]|uniref:hypothetical protein n=1 Tax=Variovorax sp. UMC13 TaxID=1862326 RepID=UPI0016026E46|nr:hypothetical protein [Variovorax sp. UMC13]